MLINGTKLLTQALCDSTEVSVYDTPDEDQLGHAVDAMNQLLDEYATERLFIPSLSITDFDLTPGKAEYKMGPGGDWDVAYPERIDRWSAVSSAGQNGEYENQRGHPLDTVQWQGISSKKTQAAYPRALYTPGDYDDDGRTTVHLWPVPTSSGIKIRLYLFASVLREIDPSRNYNLKDGYTRLLRKALAVELLTVFQKPPDPLLLRERDKSMSKVIGQNRRRPESPRDGMWNFDRRPYSTYDIRNA